MKCEKIPTLLLAGSLTTDRCLLIRASRTQLDSLGKHPARQLASGAREDAFQARFCYTCCMSEDEHITVTCQNCGEEITNSRAYFKERDWECPHCGGSIISADEQE